MTTPPVVSPPASPRRFPVWLIVLLAVGGGLFALALCGILAIGGLTLLGQRVETTTSQITASDGQSTVAVPSGWTKMTDLHDSAELQTGNRAQGQFLIVLTESKADLTADLDTYAQTVLDQLGKNISSPRVSEPQSITVNGHQAIQYEIHGTVDNLNIAYWLTAIEGSQNYYQVLGWTPESKAEQSKPVIQKVVQSFQEVVPR